MKIPFIGNSPIKKNVTANLFGVGVQLLNQIVLVPFYVLFWGNELYSDWIVISALSTMFSVSDLGLNSVIQNRFSIKLSEGSHKECNSLLMVNYVLVGAILIPILLGCALFIGSWDITEVMSLHRLSRSEANFIFILLVLKIFIGMFSGIENAIYRATHHANIAVFMDQIGNLTIALITLGCMLWEVPMTILSLAICLPQLILCAIKHIHSRTYYRFRFSWRDVDLSQLKAILLPSLSFMAFPLGNTIILQGYTLIVNSFFGADSVVIYNSTRTLCNFAKTLMGVLQGAVWPEYSIAFGKQDFNLMRHLHRKTLKTTVVISILACAGLLMFGPFIFRIWLHNTLPFDYGLMATYVLTLFMESLWISSSVTLMATNNHTRLGIMYLLSASLSIAGAHILAQHITDCSLALIASTLILMHTIMMYYTLRASFRFTQDSLFRQ